MRRFCFAALVVASCLPLFAATEPNPTARQRELIEKLIVATKMDQAGPAMMDVMFAEIQKQYIDEAAKKRNDPDAIADAKDLFTSFRDRASKIDFAGLMHEAYVRIYAKHFTEQELADLTAFYTTPTGQKSIAVMPQLVSEGMQAGVQHIAPKIEEIMNQVAEEQEKKRPWRRTMADIRQVATALEEYALEHDDRYPAGDYASLEEILAPYIEKFPGKDIWGQPYAYVVSDDKKHYRIISGGADANFEWDSRRIVLRREGEDLAVVRYRERLEDDIIFADHLFIQVPVQAKPKNAP